MCTKNAQANSTDKQYLGEYDAPTRCRPNDKIVAVDN